MARKVVRRSKVNFPKHSFTGHHGLPMNPSSFSDPHMRKALRSIKKAQRPGAPKMKGAHPLHDPTGKIHAMTGAHLTDGHLRHHSAITHMRPYKIPKGMHPKKRMG